MDKVIYGCAAHIEDLLDVFLDEVEEMPVMAEISDTDAMCHECQERALYQLFGSDVKTQWE